MYDHDLEYDGSGDCRWYDRHCRFTLSDPIRQRFKGLGGRVMSKWMVSAVAGIVSMATVAIVIKKRKAY